MCRLWGETAIRHNRSRCSNCVPRTLVFPTTCLCFSLLASFPSPPMMANTAPSSSRPVFSSLAVTAEREPFSSGSPSIDGPARPAQERGGWESAPPKLGTQPSGFGVRAFPPAWLPGSALLPVSHWTLPESGDGEKEGRRPRLDFTPEASPCILTIKPVSVLFVPLPLSPSDLHIVDAQKNESDGRILREKSKRRQSLPSNFQPLLVRGGWTFISQSQSPAFSWTRLSLWPLPCLTHLVGRYGMGGGRRWRGSGAALSQGPESRGPCCSGSSPRHSPPSPRERLWGLGPPVNVNWTQFNLM